MNKTILLLALVGVLGISLSAGGQKADEEDASFWMKKKLEFSQHILKGLATADFDQITKSATSMKNLNQIENWTRRTHADAYRTQLRVFQFANDELVRQAARRTSTAPLWRSRN